jgi:hypothetical protein
MTSLTVSSSSKYQFLHCFNARSALIPVLYDIAILKLASPIQMSNGFVCLPINKIDQFVGANVTASGWGLTSADDTEPSKVIRWDLG